MSRCPLLYLIPLVFPLLSFSQMRREDIHTDFVLYPKRTMLEKDLRERVIGKNFSIPLDSNTEYRYESACNAISQFLFHSPEVEQGFSRLFAGYDQLSSDTRRAFLEAVYAVDPKTHCIPIRAILEKETDPKLFAICAAYLHRCDTATDNTNFLKIRMVEKFPGYDSVPILLELESWLTIHEAAAAGKTPDPGELFAWQATTGQKIIYSFQRWDRDYPGLAIVQNSNGRFVRDQQGRLQIFYQLARSGSDLPYFITNGSTPQGIYSIQGTGVSRTYFIGPTPNLQLIMPNEDSWARYFLAGRDSAAWSGAADPKSLLGAGSPGSGSSGSALGSAGSTQDSLLRYQSLLPAGWRGYAPMMEAWHAGKIGRTEIIAHGTTIDPEYFKGRPFYPLTPTMGCLCAKELWNPTSGRLLESEQFGLVSAFLSTPGSKGYLYVIDVDDQRKPVSRQEVEGWVKKFEDQKSPAGAGL
ncbi:MAG TPA: hypothetical protein VK563_04445 [Puia sp.]|nr:hypothetical protein [Puia sp.]